MQRIFKILSVPAIAFFLLLLLEITASAEAESEKTITASRDYVGEEIPTEESLSEEERVKLVFYSGAVELFEKEVLSGALLDEPSCKTALGFTHTGWYFDRELKNRCYFDEPFYSNTELFAGFSLNPPEFRISSQSVTYNKERHLFGLDSVSHPLDYEGTYSYEWYRFGEYFSSGEKISLKNVGDTGEYSVKITFTYGQYSASVTSPVVKIAIEKACVAPPSILPASFSGELTFPDIPKSTLYTFEFDGARSAGVYPVSLSLCDFENYKWEGTNERGLVLDFEILMAENFFVQEPSVFDVYFMAEDVFSAIPKFGELEISYFEADAVTPASGIPSEVGDYFAIFFVKGTSDYTPLTSELLPFKILEEKALGISVSTPPERTDYTAFEHFVGEGLSVLVSYNSGRSEILGADKLSFSYQSAESFRFGDSAVKISYLGTSVFLPVNVKKADYDIGDITVEDFDFEYTGELISPQFSGSLPVGIDGIPLKALAVGGGTDAGEYEIKIIFSANSENYNTPSSLAARLIIRKKEVTLLWEGTEFVYNGKKQCPRAYFEDVFGTLTEISVFGAAYNAGDDYQATVSDVRNYSFTNPNVLFSIKKADYELGELTWSGGEFTYNGTEQSVFIEGLPEGVSVGGYANNSFINAGKYTAEVSLVYDEINYNEPKAPVYEWCILPGEYDLSGFRFEDCVSVFDGDLHYPSLVGKMPTGLDGISLRYSFSGGARHVGDGTLRVEISFATDSKNYKTPSSIFKTVRIKPKPILVLWEGEYFTYDGSEHLPVCRAAECSVTLSGAGINAGEYTAYAVSDNSDYFIENSEFSFTVKKAKNYFINAPFCKDIFEGYAPVFGGTAHFGEIIFKIFTDADLKNEIQSPNTAGIYYALAYIPESENYSELLSEPFSFSVIEVIPTGIDIEMKKSDYTAFELISPDDFLAYLIYNDGTSELISGELVSISYESAESLRATDKSADFSYTEFHTEISLNVKRAVFDTSVMSWTGLRNIYDGEEKRASLTGLANGLTLLRIDGGVGTEAGEYRATAIFEYDKVNYEEPIFEDGVLVIERKRLPKPVFSPVSYNGNPHIPYCDSEDYLINGDAEILNVGKYELTVSLRDSRNCVFADGEDTALCVFEVLPRKISISVPEIRLYLGQKYKNPEFEAHGTIEGEELGIRYILTEKSVIITAENPNYELYQEVPLYRSDLPSPRVRLIIYIILLLLIFLILLCVAFRQKRYRLALALAGMKKERGAREAAAVFEEIKPKEASAEEIKLEDFSVPMNPERADSLISNSLAKELIGEEGECILTDGRRRRIINVDTLSENFSAGERVDVNILKSKSLVPYDTAYIKVLARGIIDKPLNVYANDFSTTAVKMLALTGGKAVKITTVKTKKY